MNSDAPTIVTDQLEMRFRSCKALRKVDMVVEPGTVFALLGENGAGKTTLINLLTGFYKPTGGSCEVMGLSPSRHPERVRRMIGYVPDDPPLYGWMTPSQMGTFAASFFGGDFRKRFSALMNQYQIDVGQKIRHLSKGQHAKVALSLAIAHDPALLILDEPTSGLDPKVRRQFLESMIDRAGDGRTVFLSSHQIGEVERVADTIAILHQGRIVVSGSLHEVRESVTRVEIDFNSPLPEPMTFPAFGEILLTENVRRGRRLFVRNFDRDATDTLRGYSGVVDVQVHQASLEEVFVACTQPDETQTDRKDATEQSDALTVQEVGA